MYTSTTGPRVLSHNQCVNEKQTRRGQRGRYAVEIMAKRNSFYFHLVSIKDREVDFQFMGVREPRVQDHGLLLSQSRKPFAPGGRGRRHPNVGPKSNGLLMCVITRYWVGLSVL